MTAFLTINGKDYSHKDVNLIRDFFTDEQWDLIDYALCEYQDHDSVTDKCKETLDVIYQLFRSSYQELITMSCLQNEIILENLFEEVQTEFPDLSEDEQIKKTYELFEDLIQ